MCQDDETEKNIIAGIKNELFEAALRDDRDVLTASVKAIHSFLNCTECSLWSINHNSTGIEYENRDFASTSLIYRENPDSYIFKHGTDYVHDLKDGLFKRVIYTEEPKNPVFVYNKKEVLDSGYRSREFVDICGLTQFIVIPVYDDNYPSDNNSRIVIALFEISYKNCKINKSTWEKISSIIGPFFTTALKRAFYVKKQALMGDLINCHRKHRNKEAEVLFMEIIRSVLQKACPAQGVSVFIWDNYQNRYQLSATTGLEGNPNPLDVFYLLGERRTGEAGKTGKPFIIEDMGEEIRGKYQETLRNSAQTAMLIPIKDPSQEKGVIGIFRMVNKTNVCNNKYVDFFNDSDIELMVDAAEYLGLIVANYQKEESQYNFIDKLTHEFTTPANAIWKTAIRLYDHLSDEVFISQNLSPYLRNIIDFAEQQRWQASTNLFLSKNRRKQSFDVRYNNKPTVLWDVIQKSIDIAIPIARKHKVPFRNIYIGSKSDRWLKINIDKDAFVSVFYNLFTNAIKYHDPLDKDLFYIKTSYWIEGQNLIITIEDNGIGIKPSDQEKIFDRGYRSESALRINASGYGIGLTVIKQIVEDFGGEIEITSLNNPTVFRIKIPTSKIQ